MRLLPVFYCLLVLASLPGQAQPVKSKPASITCEALCGELFTSIRAEPDKMVMRLEEALVIHESCAADIVTAAIDAVNAEPNQVRKIVETAMDLAPARAAMITAAVKHYTVPVVVAAAEEPMEVRRAVVPDAQPPMPATLSLMPDALRPMPGAQPPIPDALPPMPVARAPMLEAVPPAPKAGEVVRRAELPLQSHSIPIVEVRRAEPVAGVPIIVQEPELPRKLSDVPRAKQAK